MRAPRKTRSSLPVVVALTALCAAMVVAQTRVDPPKNKYKPEQDVEIGREAADRARRELPLLDDDLVSGYIEDLGERLTRVIPQRFAYPQFTYTFTTVNVKEINAFALPGGPMFVNRGMIEAASTEGEVVGVMAHELAHVLLRHGTAQATKAQGFQLGALAGAIAGAIIGGDAGAIISEGSRFGLGTYFLKYGRDYEKQADLLGAQLMADAHYDPRSLASMFETIAKEGGSGGPEWLSSHPNPGNRSAYIQQEAAILQVGNPITRSNAFDAVKRRLGQLDPAPSSEDAARRSAGGDRLPADRRVEPPSTRYRSVRGGDIFQAQVPSNWQEISSNSAVKYAPQGAYGRLGQETVFTHGVEFGLASSRTRDLRSATNSLIDALSRSNPQLRVEGNTRAGRVSGRQALLTPLSNVSDATRQTEAITVTTAFLNDGTLFYYLTVAPEADAPAYQGAFDRVLRSVSLKR
ncbi:MAG: M48 family metalloprotease [Vicinamibacterales bacterium]